MKSRTQVSIGAWSHLRPRYWFFQAFHTPPQALALFERTLATPCRVPALPGLWRRLMLMKYAAVLFAVVVAMTGCGSEIVVDVSQVEASIEEFYESFPDLVEGSATADCGEDRQRPSEPGSSFICELSDDVGFIFDVEVTVLDEEGKVEYGAVD